MFQRLNLITALVLISLSVWMYKSSVNPSIIHLFPFLIGIVLLALNNGVKEGAKEQTKVAAAISLILAVVAILLYFIPNPYTEEDFGIFVIIIGIMGLMTFLTFLKNYRSKPTTR